MEHLDLIFRLVVTGIVGLVWWDVRTIRNDTRRELKSISESHQACQLELPEKYATRDNVDKLWERTDRHADKISFFKGKLNGKVA